MIISANKNMSFFLLKLLILTVVMIILNGYSLPGQYMREKVESAFTRKIFHP